jgi:2-polyprenyl-3-methyl-5-hydroxy-6-metoxy-1,4-benzoquinol methylase
MRAILHGNIYLSMFRGDATCPVPHVNLAEWADLVLVAPASATTIARLAAGDHGELCAAIALGTTAPVVIAPSMNQAMLRSPGVRRNLDRLRDDGFAILHSALGVEVAHAPETRRPMLGPAPPAAAIADQVDHILAESLAARRPAAPEEWERAWSAVPDEQLPWHTAVLDADLAAALDRLASTGARRLIDLGCGDGVAALSAARSGFQVVAVDLSASALDRARRRAAAGDAAASITWIRDDATNPRLWGAFDVLVDRALLHVLPLDRRAAYAATLARLAAPGAHVLIKTHAPSEGAAHRTVPPTRDELAALFGDAFELVSSEETTLPGPAAAPAAILTTLRRR